MQMYDTYLAPSDRIDHQPDMVASPFRGQLRRGNEYPLSPFAPENLVSRVTFGCIWSLVSLLIVHTQATLLLLPDFYYGFH